MIDKNGLNMIGPWMKREQVREKNWSGNWFYLNPIDFGAWPMLLLLKKDTKRRVRR